ncbi:Alpha/Beta hydrolase protein [Cladochytrium replicatum]|nr:Alpha/Beta hydrolase protein [Cladochytrium replicatum]
MLDHIVGRPSANFKRIQVVLLLYCANWVLNRYGERAPTRFLRFINNQLALTPPWKIVAGTITAVYFARNFFLLSFLNAPEPLARMYTRSFYRATWILTGLDAGFLSAMHIKPKWLRDLLSVIFSVYYIMFPDDADEKVRKFRALATVQMMRTSWEKGKNPYLRTLSFADRGWLGVRKDIWIPRPNPPSTTHFPDMVRGPIKAKLYYTGSEAEMARASKIILQLPGGGFVTQDPECHEDYTSMWARHTRIPIVSINYGKAPEFPYPWALEECFDAYRSIVESNGESIGMEGWYRRDSEGRTVRQKDPIKIIIVGDSAGGNIGTGVVIKCLEARDIHIRPPSGLLLIYPCLSFDMACWMPPHELEVIRTDSIKTLANLIDTKSTLRSLDAPLTLPDAPRSIDVLTDKVDRSRSWYKFWEPRVPKPKAAIPTALSMTSRFSYFTDRLISPEMLRVMALLYLAKSPVTPRFQEDYYLSPVVAPDSILARFPKTYFLCGEKDPFVDDTIVFAGRLRDAKAKAHKEWERVRRRAARRQFTPYGGNSSGEVSGIASPGGALGMKPVVKVRLPPPGGKKHSGWEKVYDEPDDEEVDDDDDAVTPEELGIDVYGESFAQHMFAREPDQMVRVKVLEGMSHAILMMTALLPEARQATDLTGSWMLEMFRDRGLFDPSDASEALTDYMIHEIQEMGSTANLSVPNSPFPAHRFGPQHQHHHNTASSSSVSLSGMLSPGAPLTPGGYYPTRGASLDVEHARVLADSTPNASPPLPITAVSGNGQRATVGASSTSISERRGFGLSLGQLPPLPDLMGQKNRQARGGKNTGSTGSLKIGAPLSAVGGSKKMDEVNETRVMERRRDAMASSLYKEINID